MSDTVHSYTVTRQPGDLSAAESPVAVVMHTDPAIARARATSHCQRLQRLDASLSVPPIYRVHLTPKASK